MVLEEKIRITEVKELDRIDDEESQKRIDYIKDSLKKDIENRINLADINRLLDKTGKRLPEAGWKTLNTFIPIRASEDSDYKKYKKSLIYCVILPLTSYRKKILIDKEKARGIKSYVRDKELHPIEEYDKFDENDGWWLYLRKLKKLPFSNRNEFRIGIVEVGMKHAGMGVIPWIEEIQDLLAIKYRRI